MEGFAAALGLDSNNQTSWKSVTISDLVNVGGQRLLEKYGYDMRSLLKAAYPEYKWPKGLFRRGRFSISEASLQETRKFISSIALKLGINDNDLSAWYKVPFTTLFKEPEGEKNLKKFAYSRFDLLKAVFPDHEWHPWLFKQMISINESPDDESLMRFKEFLESKLGIKDVRDWYAVSRASLGEAGLPRLFYSQADFVNFLKRVYPGESWDVGRLAWTSLGRSNLRAALALIFPHDEIVSARTHFSDQLSETSGYPFDQILVLPKYRLLFEYRSPITYAKEIIEAHEFLEKKASSMIVTLASTSSFSLIPIPFWWPRTQESLIAEIYNHRKDLFLESGSLHQFATRIGAPITENFPLREFTGRDRCLRVWSKDPRFSQYFGMRSPKSYLRKYEKLTEAQLIELRRSFSEEPTPSKETLGRLSEITGLSRQRVSDWFRFQRRKNEPK